MEAYDVYEQHGYGLSPHRTQRVVHVASIAASFGAKYRERFFCACSALGTTAVDLAQLDEFVEQRLEAVIDGNPIDGGSRVASLAKPTTAINSSSITDDMPCALAEVPCNAVQ